MSMVITGIFIFPQKKTHSKGSLSQKILISSGFSAAKMVRKPS